MDLAQVMMVCRAYLNVNIEELPLQDCRQKMDLWRRDRLYTIMSIAVTAVNLSIIGMARS